MFEGAKISIGSEGSVADMVDRAHHLDDPDIYDAPDIAYTSAAPGLEVSEGYNDGFLNEATTPGFIEAFVDRTVLGNVNEQFKVNPETLSEDKVMEAPALATGAIAMAASDAKVAGNTNFGQKFDVSQKADSTKFFKGQQTAEQKNDVKLDQTTTSVEVLAGAHQKLAGAEMQMRANMMGNPSGASKDNNTQSATNADNPVNKSTSDRLVQSMLIGSAATSVAAFLAPGALPVVKAAAAIGTANAAGNMFGNNSSPNYDKPRSKAEAREMRDPASAANSTSTPSNYFDNTTAGGMIMPPSDVNSSFNKASSEPSAPTPYQDYQMAQIAELAKAKGAVWKEGVTQTAQMEDAEVAAEFHEEWRVSGVSKYGLNEVIRAAESDALSGGDDLLAAIRKTEDTTALSRAIEENKIPELNPDNMNFAPSFGGGMKMGA